MESWTCAVTASPVTDRSPGTPLANTPHANIVFVPGAAHNIRSGDLKHVYLQELDHFIEANLH